MAVIEASIQHAWNTEAGYTTANPVLLQGMIYFSSDAFYGSSNCPKYKVGNGTDTWLNTDYHPDTTGGLTSANNGLSLNTGVAQAGGALIKDTTVAAGAFDYKVTSVPEANKTAEYEASQDLFGLLALVGNAINGQGNRYVLTHDGNGDPESWLFQKVSNDTSVGGSYNSTIGYINLATGIECYFEVTTAGVRMVTTDGTNQTGLTVTQATEIIEAIVNGVTKMTIDSSGVTVNNLTSAGDRLVFANLNGLLGIKTSAQATAMLDNMVGDSGAGGAKGLVPAPAAGDAAANKFLKANGTWATASSASYLRFFGSYTTISASAGTGYGSPNFVYFGSILIPGGTVQAGDIIQVQWLMRNNAGGLTASGWMLSDFAGVPTSAVAPGTNDSSGHKFYVAYLSQTLAYHIGGNTAIVAAGTGFTAPASSTTALNLTANGCINDTLNTQVTNIAQYADTTTSWASDRYIVFCHTSAVASTTTFMGGWVKILRP